MMLLLLSQLLWTETYSLVRYNVPLIPWNKKSKLLQDIAKYSVPCEVIAGKADLISFADSATYFIPPTKIGSCTWCNLKCWACSIEEAWYGYKGEIILWQILRNMLFTFCRVLNRGVLLSFSSGMRNFRNSLLHSAFAKVSSRFFCWKSILYMYALLSQRQNTRNYLGLKTW